MRMVKSRTLYSIGTIAVVLATAACGGESGSDGTSQDPPASAGAPAAGGGLVSTQEVDGVGTILTDADGMALYTTEAEIDGTVRCVDTCSNFWPPLTGAADSVPSNVEGISGEFGVVARPDGAEQITLDGLPLYTFTEDRQPGTVMGDGFEDDFQGAHFVWHVVRVGDAAGGDSGGTGDGGGGFDY